MKFAAVRYAPNQRASVRRINRGGRAQRRRCRRRISREMDVPVMAGASMDDGSHARRALALDRGSAHWHRPRARLGVGERAFGASIGGGRPQQRRSRRRTARATDFTTVAGSSTGDEAHGRRTLELDGGIVRWHRCRARLGVGAARSSRRRRNRATAMRGAKPPRRVAEPPESARSASRGAQRSVALGCSVDLGVRREGSGSWV